MEKKNIDQLKRIPITGLLSRCGIEPKSIRGNDYWYCSPLRTERTPSFKVDIVSNTYIDFGGNAKRSDNIKLMQEMKNCSFMESCNILSNGEFNNQSFSFPKPALNEVKESAIKIIEVKPIWSYDLKNYLINDRGIKLNIANKFCKEVVFTCGSGTLYRSIGFENRSGGYALRNKYCKQSTSPNDYTFVAGKNNSIVTVYEGFMDFLTAIQILNVTGDSIVLNGLGNLNKAEHLLSQYEIVNVLFDNDESKTGDRATENLIGKYANCIDRREILNGCKDLNDRLLQTN